MRMALKSAKKKLSYPLNISYLLLFLSVLSFLGLEPEALRVATKNWRLMGLGVLIRHCFVLVLLECYGVFWHIFVCSFGDFFLLDVIILSLSLPIR